MPPDRKITLALCVAHGLRHDYFRNMLGLDGKSARGDHEGWVLLGNESWLRHSEQGVIIAATGAKWLVEHGMSISAAAMLPPDALALELPSAKKLLTGVSSIHCHMPTAYICGSGYFYATPGEVLPTFLGFMLKVACFACILPPPLPPNAVIVRAV